MATTSISIFISYSTCLSFLASSSPQTQYRQDWGALSLLKLMNPIRPLHHYWQQLTAPAKKFGISGLCFGNFTVSCRFSLHSNCGAESFSVPHFNSHTYISFNGLETYKVTSCRLCSAESCLFCSTNCNFFISLFILLVMTTDITKIMSWLWIWSLFLLLLIILSQFG